MHFGTKEELFDIVVADSMVKLAQSISFEDEYRKRISAIEAAQQAGKVRADIPAAELMAMVISLVISWDTTTWSLKALQPENRQRTGPDHRTRITTAVAALTEPPHTPLPHHSR